MTATESIILAWAVQTKMEISTKIYVEDASEGLDAESVVDLIDDTLSAQVEKLITRLADFERRKSA